ncbi:MAG: hemolysin, partial [Paludibacteraceae bacterium]|nr:hemolysin [Paludibacteraceae bacterium]
KGEFPTEHERIQHGRFTFEIMEMDERHIVKIKVIVKPLKTADNTSEKG